VTKGDAWRALKHLARATACLTEWQDQEARTEALGHVAIALILLEKDTTARRAVLDAVRAEEARRAGQLRAS
jgi:hypothetical protein